MVKKILIVVLVLLAVAALAVVLKLELPSAVSSTAVGVPDTYTVTSSITNGSATSATIQYGGEATVTISPSSGYELPSSVIVNGASYLYNDSTGVVSLSAPTGNVTISATCVASGSGAQSGEGGSSGSGAQSGEGGSSGSGAQSGGVNYEISFEFYSCEMLIDDEYSFSPFSFSVTAAEAEELEIKFIAASGYRFTYPDGFTSTGCDLSLVEIGQDYDYVVIALTNISSDMVILVYPAPAAHCGGSND